MVKNLKNIHRWVGIVIAVYVLMVCISGLTHIIAHNFYPAPKPHEVRVYSGLGGAKVPPNQINFGKDLQALNLRNIDGLIWYQAMFKDRVDYYNASNGLEADMDAVFARQIAADYLGKKPGKAEYVSKFNAEYSAHGHSLPVWRVEAGREWVYVSTVHGTIEQYLNPPRALTSQIFRHLHMFNFVPGEITRDIFMGIMVIGLLAVNIIGVYLFFKKRKKKKDKERK